MQHISENVVIGSGPAGIACAKALLSRGQKVLMVDASNTLPLKNRDKAAYLFSTPKTEWTKDDTTFLKNKLSPNLGGVPIKHSFGSDYPYAIPQRWGGIDFNLTGLSPSFAQGGLSTVWGASILPYTQDDIGNWPLNISDLAPHYKEVMKFMRLNGVCDQLEKFFPLYTNTLLGREEDIQAFSIYQKLNSNISQLNQRGVYFGSSRLAFNNNGYSHAEGCIECGLCMYGCPKKMIYSAESTLKDLLTDSNFTYMPNTLVEKFSESDGVVKFTVYDLNSSECLKMSTKKLFIAAGVLPSAKILIKSLNLYQQSITLKDSQYFLMPMISNFSCKDPNMGRMTLAQLFFEIIDKSISERMIHMQLYTYNEMYEVALSKIIGPLSVAFRRPMGWFLNRLILVQGYLHSDDSSSIRLSLSKSNLPHERDTLHLQSIKNPEMPHKIALIKYKLNSLRKFSGLFPIPFMTKIAMPGRSFHVGGSFPMTIKPEKSYECDLLGRPQGLRHVHVVDASCFPSIPATTITLTVMANAHRIGSYA